MSRVSVTVTAGVTVVTVLATAVLVAQDSTRPPVSSLWTVDQCVSGASSGLDVLYLAGTGDDTPEEVVTRMAAQVGHRHGPVRTETVEHTDQRVLSQFAVPSGKVVAQLTVIRVGTKWQIAGLAECSTRPAPTSTDRPITANSPAPGPAPESPSADYALPSSNAVDWVTYADHVVQILVVSEQRGSPPTKTFPYLRACFAPTWATRSGPPSKSAPAAPQPKSRRYRDPYRQTEPPWTEHAQAC